MTSTPWLSRRALLGGAAAIGSASLLSGCIGSGPGTSAPPTNGGTASGPATLQIAFSEPKPRDALLTTLKDYPGRRPRSTPWPPSSSGPSCPPT